VHLKVPVPLMLARAAVGLAPDQAVHHRIDDPDVLRMLPAARELVAALEDCEDGEYVRVEDGDELVLIRKVGAELEIDVRSSDEKVSVRVPLELAAAALTLDDDGSFDIGGVLAALGDASGELVNIDDGATRVSVRMW
jgi:hypothetical protein